MQLRAYREEDAPALLALFRDTIRGVNARDYSPEQVRVWASGDIDPGWWAGRFAGRFAVVIESGERAIGFADLEPDGHIDRFFVSADHQRRGVGPALLAAIAAEAGRARVGRMFTEASITGAARCNVANAASRATLQKAGLIPCARLLGGVLAG